MEQQIRAYVDELFAETVPTKKSVELKEEMIQNLTEKYNDLIAEGKTPEAAYNIAIAGIGDISYLLKDLEKEASDPKVTASQRQRTAMLTAIAVMLYIVSVVPLILLASLVHRPGAPIIGVVIMFVLIALATGLLIYNGMTKPKYKKADETIVEEFREWQSESHERKSLRKAIGTALWAITVAVYIIVSFLTGMWQITWVIFLVAVAINAILNATFALKK
jgi:hypothetical protein